MTPATTATPAIILLPFMYGAPREPVGGWRFLPWEVAVNSLVPEQTRPNYLRWPSKFTQAGNDWGDPHAAIRVRPEAIAIDDLVTVLAYDWLSRRSKHYCTHDSFMYQEITDSRELDIQFETRKDVSARTFNMCDADPEVLNALAKLFAVSGDGGAQLPPADQEDRLRRAIRLHNEGHWVWGQREISRPLFIITMALAFEALFTKEEMVLNREDPHALKMDEAEVKQAVADGAVDELTNHVRDFVLSTSFLEQVTVSAVDVLKTPTAGAGQCVRQRLISIVRGRLTGGSGIGANLRSGILATLSNTGMDDVTRQQMAKWCNEFYGLRSAIAHGDAIWDSDFLFGDSQWHELIARDVFRAVVFELLVRLDHLRPPASVSLRDEYTHPSLVSVVSNKKRLEQIVSLVSALRQNPPDNGHADHDTLEKLCRLLQEVNRYDASLEASELAGAQEALDALRNGLPGVPPYVGDKAEIAAGRLHEAVEMHKLSDSRAEPKRIL